MARLFVFAIGGTGARVLKSLGNLLAAGVKVDVDEIIPIIIDTDEQNADTQRTENLLKSYRDLRNQIPDLNDAFFQNRILSLGDLARQNGESGWGTNFTLKFQSTTGKTLRNYINFEYLEDLETKSLLELLYSDNNLDDSLSYGFLGSPNVGCIVLDELIKTKEFQYFGSIVQKQDRVFIISSIFGGTGAAGFPLLINNFDPKVSEIANLGTLEKMLIGAITVLPYFTLTPNKDSRIDSTSFYTKSIAALSYYAKDNIDRVNALYYIGDSEQAGTYDNIPGGGQQQNDAGFIEVASALSIIDFMKIPDDHLNGNQIYKEFSIKNNNPHLRFDDLGKETNDIIASSLVSLKLTDLFAQTVENQIGSKLTDENGFTKEFFISEFYSSFRKFIRDHFNEWLTELDGNQRGFSPFGHITIKNLTSLINGKTIGKKLLGRSSIGENQFIQECSSVKSRQATVNGKYIDVMHHAAIETFAKKISNLI
jgi:hypothetical protein